MRPKVMIAGVTALCLCCTGFARAAESSAPTKVWRIGYLSLGIPSSANGPSPTWAAFKQQLQDRGYVEGKNIAFEQRYAQTRAEYAPLAAELVEGGVDVIVADGGTPTGAARAATTTIPIVMAGATDPVGQGLVASLAHPGGNITGVADDQRNLIPKRLELLKTCVPSVHRVVALYGNFGSLDAASGLALDRENAEAVRTLNISTVGVRIDSPNDFEKATVAILREHPDALSIADNPTNGFLRKQIAQFAVEHRLPTIAASRRDAVAGILMSYGPDYVAIFRNAAISVDKILKGAKPADLPVEQSSKYELIINLQTAKALGIQIPQALRIQATDVIQ